MDEPIPHKNFTFLHQRSHEILGGSQPDTLLASDMVPKPPASEGSNSTFNSTLQPYSPKGARPSSKTTTHQKTHYMRHFFLFY